MALTFLLGGARSGKSSLAVRMAGAAPGPVVFIATAEAKDDEMTARIDTHREGRPEEWRTIEAPRSLLTALGEVELEATLIIDCVSFWVANLVMGGVTAERIEEEAGRAAARGAARPGRTIAVSNEVGLGVVPPNELGRDFRDVLGRVNAAWAAHAAASYFVVAGLVIPLGEPPIGEGDQR